MSSKFGRLATAFKTWIRFGKEILNAAQTRNSLTVITGLVHYI
jgi:hypothetical protein